MLLAQGHDQRVARKGPETGKLRGLAQPHHLNHAGDGSPHGPVDQRRVPVRKEGAIDDDAAMPAVSLRLVGEFQEDRQVAERAASRQTIDVGPEARPERPR